MKIPCHRHACRERLFNRQNSWPLEVGDSCYRPLLKFGFGRLPEQTDHSVQLLFLATQPEDEKSLIVEGLDEISSTRLTCPGVQPKKSNDVTVIANSDAQIIAQHENGDSDIEPRQTFNKSVMTNNQDT